MFNEDVLDLYPRVPVGTRVTVTWQRFNGGKGPISAEASAPQEEKASYKRKVAKYLGKRKAIESAAVE